MGSATIGVAYAATPASVPQAEGVPWVRGRGLEPPGLVSLWPDESADGDCDAIRIVSFASVGALRESGLSVGLVALSESALLADKLFAWLWH